MDFMKINHNLPVTRLLCEFYIATDGDLYVLVEFLHRKNPFESEKAFTWLCEKDFIFEI